MSKPSKKPNWRLPEYKDFPGSRIHSAMKAWAKENSQPKLYVKTTYMDGSLADYYYEPATKEVPYRHGGETYYESVDIPNKYIRMGEVLTVKQLLEAEAKMDKKLKLKVKSMTHEFV